VKEQLSQFSISQRLFGESVLGLSQGSVSDLLARPKPWHMLTQKGREPFIRMKIFLDDGNAVHKLVASQYKIAPDKLMRTGGYANGSKSQQLKYSSENQKFRMDGSKQPINIPPTRAGLIPQPYDSKVPVLDPLRMISNNARVNGSFVPSVYEMAALTQDLDTHNITTRIKENLLANNIGQKLFGEAVLGLSQGSVSELLSKPKSWHMLSIKGREPFIRMQLWLNDPQNIEKLQYLKNERRDSKRQRTMENNKEVPFDMSYDEITSKKARFLLTDEQKEALNLAYALDAYPNLITVEFLSKELQLSPRTVSNWFHNQRMRNKQMPPSPPLYPSDLSNSPFDPLHFRILLSQRLLKLRLDKGSRSPEQSPDSGNEAEDHMRALLKANNRQSSSPVEEPVSSANDTNSSLRPFPSPITSLPLRINPHLYPNQSIQPPPAADMSGGSNSRVDVSSPTEQVEPFNLSYSGSHKSPSRSMSPDAFPRESAASPMKIDIEEIEKDSESNQALESLMVGQQPMTSH